MSAAAAGAAPEGAAHEARTPRIRLVTFDLDDTLWRTDGVIRRAEAKMWEWLRLRGVETPPPDAATVATIRADVLAANPDVAHDISRLRELMVRAMLERGGHTPQKATALAAGAFAEFLDWRHRVEFFPHALAVLDKLHRHYTLAALTNGNADYRRLGLDRYFAFGYSAADVGASKPHPAMFERALARANVTPAQAVHVGDHPVDDIQGATAVGMATIQVAHATPPATPRSWLDRSQSAGGHPTGAPAATVTTLRDLPNAIAALSG